MYKFNGYYGCHYCTVNSKTLGRTHAYYPYIERGEVRDPILNDLYVEIAECHTENEIPNVIGVKGRSAFAGIIDGLPLTAPVDYMHCVLLGVFPELLWLCHKTLPTQDKNDIQLLISELQCPREVLAYSRKIRPLEEVGQFKANELFNWRFYLSPVVFLNRLPEDLYLHLTNLVFGVRLLLESSDENSICTAEKLLDEFSREVVTVHGSERIETINVHCLMHLSDQVRNFGPLICQSAMSFEAANRTIEEVFTCASSELDIICRRILQSHKLSWAEIQSDKLKPLFVSFPGNVYPMNPLFVTSLLKHRQLKKHVKRMRVLVFRIGVLLTAATLILQHTGDLNWETAMLALEMPALRNLELFSTSLEYRDPHSTSNFLQTFSILLR